MRPLHLRVEGFASFREATDVDFQDAEYFALVGPTGSGKSSLIDAIAFVLYGSVPRYDDRRLVAPIISQGRVESRVGLDFAIGSTAYRVARVVRSTGKGKGATTKEARLERLDPHGGVAETIAGDADGVTSALASLLGLTFDHFTKCVVLPQGDFARFLHDKPAARQDLLVELLGLGIYGQVGQRANQEASAAAQRAASAEDQLSRPPLDTITAEAAAAAARRVSALDDLRARVAAEEPRLAELVRTQTEAEAEAEAARERVRVLTRVTVPHDLAVLDADVRAADGALGDARLAVATCEDALAAVEQDVAQLPSRTDLEGAARGHAERIDLQARVDNGRDRVARLNVEEADARRELLVRERGLAEAHSARQATTELHQATVLRRTLVAGHACPVCDQLVSTVPGPAAAPDLEAAELFVANAEGELKRADDTARDIAERRVAAEATVHGLDEQLTVLHARLLGYPDAAEVESLLTRVRTAEERLTLARSALANARSAHKSATHRRESLEATATAAWQRFDTARDIVAGLGPPSVSRDDLTGAWNTLADWAGQRRPAEVAAERAAEERGALAGAEQTRRVGALIDACRSVDVILDVASGSGAMSPAEAVAEARASALAALEQARSSLAESERLQQVVATSTEEAGVARALAQHLKSTGFEQWLLDEVLEQLVVGATQVLRELSCGAYSLVVDGVGGFAVIDHRNADLVRSARTLSGGETFLASLALALALADRLAGFAVEGAPPLEAIFLDEGFGTLDPETLDTVAAAMENLAASGRVVGLVTHVRELAERVPIRFEVEKGLTTSTVRRVEG